MSGRFGYGKFLFLKSLCNARRASSLFILLLTVIQFTYAKAEDVESVDSDKPVRLDEVEVRGTEETALGPTEDYVANRNMSGMKTDTPILETPQGLSVITNYQIMDQGAQNLQDALRYTPGVRTEAYGLDSRGDWAFIRGTDFTQYQDGLRTFFDFFSNVRPEPYAIERIEVMRGPASVLYGQGMTGGIVNVVSKRPQQEEHREINLQYGNYDRQQAAMDFTGPLTEDGDWLYRIVGVLRDSETMVDFSESDRWLIAPSLTWQPTDYTRLTLLANIQRDTGTVTTAFPPWSGTLLPNPNGEIPTERFTSEPGYDTFDNDQDAIGWQFEHAFNERWTVRQNLRYSSSGVDYRTLYPDVFSNPANPFLDPAQRTVARFGYIRQQEDEAWTLDNHLQSNWTLGMTEHTVLMGIDYSHAMIEKKEGFNFVATPFDLFNPVYGNFAAPVAVVQPDSTSYQVGVYFQDQIKIGRHWILTGGFRHDWTETEVQGGNTLDEAALTGRVGLIYLADNGLAPYVSYSQSFNPITSTDIFNRPYKPVRGEQIEGGLRYQPPGSNSIYTASVFDIQEENRLSPDPANPFNEIQLGEANIWGVELEAVANLTRNLDLIATYSYTDAHTQDGINPERNIAEVVPHIATAWLKYDFSLGDMPGFTSGFGVRYYSSHHDELEVLEIPSETLFDAMLGYETGDWGFAVNGTNITDETYITTCLSRGDCWYGSRATVVGSITYDF